MDKGSSIPSPHHARKTGRPLASESLAESMENILGLIWNQRSEAENQRRYGNRYGVPGFPKTS